MMMIIIIIIIIIIITLEHISYNWEARRLLYVQYAYYIYTFTNYLIESMELSPS
jgi:hypothetical protein